MQMNSQNTSQTDDGIDIDYLDKWNSHIGDLIKLGFYLEKEDQERLKELAEELYDIAEVAAVNKRREERDGVMDAEYVTHTGDDE